MESLEPTVLGPLVLGGGLGLLLARLGLRYRMLEQRQEGRCPACGIIRRRGACSCNR